MAIDFACRTEARTLRRHNDRPDRGLTRRAPYPRCGLARAAPCPFSRPLRVCVAEEAGPRRACAQGWVIIWTTPATAILRRPMRRQYSSSPLANPDALGSPQNKGAADCSAAPIVSRELPYFRLVIAVRSAESLAMPAAPHQLEPNAVAPLPGLIAVTKHGLALVVL